MGPALAAIAVDVMAESKAREEDEAAQQQEGQFGSPDSVAAQEQRDGLGPANVNISVETERSAAAAAEDGRVGRGGGDGESKSAAAGTVATTAASARGAGAATDRFAGRRNTFVLMNVTDPSSLDEARGLARPASLFHVLTEQHRRSAEAQAEQLRRRTNSPQAGMKGHEGSRRAHIPWRKRIIFLFPPGGRVNSFALSLVGNHRFEVAITVLIVISSIALGLENPASRNDPTFLHVMFGLEIFFTTMFMIEAVLKILAIGLVWESDSYLRSGWNVLDFLVVVGSVFNLFLYFDNELSWIKIVRLFRTLRPLLLVARSESMRVIVFALSISVQAIVNVVAVLLLTWFMFAILGQQLFGGYMDDCSDPAFPEGKPFAGIVMEPFAASPVSDAIITPSPSPSPSPSSSSSSSSSSVISWASPPCSGTFLDPKTGLIAEKTVAPFPSNFDNVGAAMLTLFVMSSLEAWPDIMFRACDISGKGLSRSREANWGAAYYFVTFVAVGVFFFINLFIGVIYANFAALKDDYRGDALLSTEQKNW